MSYLCLTLSMSAAARLLVLSPSCLLQVGQCSTRPLHQSEVSTEVTWPGSTNHSSPAGAAHDVAGGAAGDGQGARDDEAHRALHHWLQVPVWWWVACCLWQLTGYWANLSVQLLRWWAWLQIRPLSSAELCDPWLSLRGKSTKCSSELTIVTFSYVKLINVMFFLLSPLFFILYTSDNHCFLIKLTLCNFLRRQKKTSSFVAVFCKAIMSWHLAPHTYIWMWNWNVSLCLSDCHWTKIKERLCGPHFKLYLFQRRLTDQHTTQYNTQWRHWM